MKPTTYRTPGGETLQLYLDILHQPHTLIAGASGSGKSVAINGIISALAKSSSPAKSELVLIDPKRVELSVWKKLPHTIQVATEPDDIISTLQAVLRVIDDRYRYCERQSLKFFPGAALYVIIDELADLMLTMRECKPLLQRILQIGRAAAVHVIAATQCPLASVIPTAIKCNFSAVLGLRTATAQQSRFLIATTGCETLPDPKREGKGYGFLRDGADLQKYSLHMYTDDDIQQLVNYWQSPACRAM